MNLFDSPTLLTYLAAAAVLVLVPGPGTAWIVAQTVAGGTARDAHRKHRLAGISSEPRWMHA